MKTHTKPKMKINVFQNENVLTGSGAAEGTETSMEAWSEENNGARVIRLDRNDLTLVF